MEQTQRYFLLQDPNLTTHNHFYSPPTARPASALHASGRQLGVKALTATSLDQFKAGAGYWHSRTEAFGVPQQLPTVRERMAQSLQRPSTAPPASMAKYTHKPPPDMDKTLGTFSTEFRTQYTDKSAWYKKRGFHCGLSTTYGTRF